MEKFAIRSDEPQATRSCPPTSTSHVGTGPTLVVMAAGMGARFGGIKQVEPVGPGGESLLEYSLYDAARAGFGRVVFVIRREIEALFRERIGRRIEHAIETCYAFQALDDLPGACAVPGGRSKPWGTGHAVLSARHEVCGPFAVVNGDDFYGRRSFAAIADFLRSADGRRHALVGYAVEKTLTEHGLVARGLCAVDGEGRLAGITERTRIRPRAGAAEYTTDGVSWHPIPRGTRVSMNLWGFAPGMMGELERRFLDFLATMPDPLRSEYFLPAVVDALIGEGQASVVVLPTDDPWFGLTFREDLPHVREAVRALIADGEYPERLWGKQDRK
jgi:hypothetical protein